MSHRGQGSGVRGQRSNNKQQTAHMFDTVESRFRQINPEVDFCSLRLVEERSERISVRQGILQPVQDKLDVGAMVTVHDRGGTGYAATSDLSPSGLSAAVEQAKIWAQKTAGSSVFDFSKVAMPAPVGEYSTPVAKSWDSLSLADKIDLLQQTCTSLKSNDRVVDWEATLWYTEEDILYITADGARVRQKLHLMAPQLRVTAAVGSNTQTRSFGLFGESQQGGLEVLDRIRFRDRAPQLSEEALQLLEAPNCPSEKMDLLLTSDQMLIQIHESIGHPLELDRILGDERNFAGTSFVSLDMFGSYQYGSELLNVTFNPEHPEQLASYGFDDCGSQAEKTFIIEKGILKRPLGSLISQARAGLPGAIANARASSWNRPPIDRMANLNIEPGNQTLQQLINSIERGVLMRTNWSWSIDDSRNKFQFGCEWGQLIEDGQLTKVVKNPNYRGISASFWRNLKGLGDSSTFELLGSPFCGKGEPTQIIRVGHGSPACVFANVDVFGGD